MEFHEFWLKAGREEHGWNPKETLPIYRVALGELIDATQRKTYPPVEGSKDPNFWNKSGSIGFMDLRVKTQLVPRDGARPYPNPSQNPFLEHEFLMEDYEERETLTIEVMGVEPENRGQSYARFLKKRAEEIALEWGLDIIVAEMIDNRKIRNIARRYGFQLYDGGSNAVKRLNQA